jgi:hypothetical protein
MEATDFKNVIVENIPPAFFAVSEVIFRNFIEPRKKRYYIVLFFLEIEDFEILKLVT